MNASYKIDFHCHSFYSDGALTPEALLQKALHAQIDLLALTDHDTVSGVQLLIDAAAGQAIQIIPGIELSARWKLHDIHILGLNIDIHHPGLLAALQKQNHQRIERAKHIASLLEKIGMENVYQNACLLAGHERLGRPHFAQLLVNENKVSDMQSAFKRYLGRGKSAYVPTSWLSMEETVQAIQACGGHAVLAHPVKYKLTQTKLRNIIDAFKDMGGSGLEVVSGETSLLEINAMSKLCQEFGLLGSSGSDYHNDTYSRIKLGQQQGLPLNCTPIWTKWM